MLFTENKYNINAPIANAEIVIINEVDKASSAIRNAMLGVMNERFLFNGKHKIPCKWKLFIATCNEIPKEEINSPFWDRFILKHEVKRISSSDILEYYTEGAKDYKSKVQINIPNEEEINSVVIPTSKLGKYLNIGYNQSSDRTLTFVPRLIKAISYIWNTNINKACVKTASIILNNSAASALEQSLSSPTYSAILSKIDLIVSFSNPTTEIENILDLISKSVQSSNLDEIEAQELERELENSLDLNFPHLKKSDAIKNSITDIDGTGLLPEFTDVETDLFSKITKPPAAPTENIETIF